MARRPSAYSTLNLANKHTLCRKAATEPSWTLSQLTQWATQEFQTHVKRSTLQGILKRKRDYEDVPSAHSLRKRLCTASQRSSDEYLMKRIEAYKRWHGNATVTGAIVTSIASREGIQLPSGTEPSRGWLYRFQQRTGLWFLMRHGEGGSLDTRAVDEGVKSLKAVVAKYHPRDVYNMDETSFFYRREPKGTLTVNRTEKGKKQSKERITACVATNADGTERLPLHFIGKSEVPRPLKGRDVFAEIGATYTNTLKAWMNTTKYCEWLKQLNESMVDQQRHVLLLVDNVSSHNDEPVELTNVVVHKLPPNTTAALQPMDQGIIKSLKDHYRAKKQEAELDMFYRGEKYTPVNIYTAMKWCSEGWQDVSTMTIRNCWNHTGIVSKMDLRFVLN